jgi:hypothetical protein
LRKRPNFRGFLFLLVLLAAPACRLQNPYPEAPGTLFIRQQICDIDDFKKSFFRPQNNLKGHGFRAYSFSRDPKDPKTYILAFSCADLRKGVAFVRSSNFLTACIGSGMGLPLMWAGVQEDRPDPNLARKTGGMVVARYEVKDFEAWTKIWDSQKGTGKTGSGTGLYRLDGDPEVVIVTREVSDITQAQAPMDSQALLTAGVNHQDLWLGTHLEDGTF